MKLPVLLLLGVCLASGGVSSAAGPAGFRVRFGTLRVNDAGTAYILAEESTDLLRKFKDTGYRWGIEVTTSDANIPYTLQYVFHLPAPPDQVTGDLAKPNPTRPGATVTSNKLKIERTTLIRQFWFDPGDPVGEWKLEIFVNEQPAWTITFQVRNE
jgi:hypothetical protein